MTATTPATQPTGAGLGGAACRGQWRLFDSIDPRDHAEAREICARCPLLLRCAMTLREVEAATRGVRNAGGGPVGTWAGKLVGAAPPGLPRRGKRRPREHGTDRGYHQHRFYREAACADCKAAHVAAVAASDARSNHHAQEAS